MANPENLYTGNGSTVLYSFTFPYIETTDIKVSLNGVDTTAYTLANATQIQFNVAPSNGVSIRIYRQTDTSTIDNTFFAGSSIRAKDLNENFTKLLYGNQETQMITVNASSGNLADLSVTSSKIADNSISTAKIADGAVTSVKILDNSVVTSKILDANVTTAKIADNAITSAKIAANAITTDKILDGTILSTDLSAGAVDTTALANNAVTTAKITDANVTAAKLDSTTVSRIARAWVNFNGTGTVAMRANYNVTSITDNDVGDYTVNFTSAISDANYAFSVSHGGTSNIGAVVVHQTVAPTTSALRINTRTDGGASSIDTARISVIVFR